MRRPTCLVVLTIVVSLLLPLAAAQAGDMIRATVWTVKPGAVQQFEDGIKKHNQLHQSQGDSWAFIVGEYVSGDQQGQYIRFTPDHDWADFDAEYEILDQAADAADMAANVMPHVASAQTTFYEYHPEMSHAAPGPMALNKVIVFQLKPFQADAFVGAVQRIHGVLSNHEGGWPPYEWYSVDDGGMGDQFIVVLPRENWAGFADRDPSFEEVVGQGLGADAPAVFKALGDAVAKTWSHTIALRPDLSYMPAGGGNGE